MSKAVLKIESLYVDDQQELSGDELYFVINGQKTKIPGTLYENDSVIFPLTNMGYITSVVNNPYDFDFTVTIMEDDPGTLGEDLIETEVISSNSTNNAQEEYFTGSGGNYQIVYDVFWVAN